MRFESKRDLWFVLVLRVMPLVLLLVIGDIWYLQHHDLRGPLAGAIILILFEVFLFETMLRSTYYRIDGHTLVIRSSIFSWRVPIGEIRSITPTRSAVSSPALSFDRLRIEYGGKAILVSPEDPKRFIEALRAQNPSIVT